MSQTKSEILNKQRLLASSIGNLFKIHKERPGYPLHTKPIKRLFHQWGKRELKKGFKIDFILEPSERLISIGWELGCVGVEAKPSPLEGAKFGRAISQILDYQNSSFSLSDEHTEAQQLSMIFLLGPDRFHGTEASILMQEGIGLIRIPERYPEIKFLHGNGMHPILTIHEDTVKYTRPRFGMGTGHR